MKSLMKNWKKWFTMAALVAVIIPAAGLAQGHRYGVNRRERNQQHRIRQGVRSGELTRVEAARLEREQARIRLAEARARRSGGDFTLRERARIQRGLNQSSRRIYRQKHDRQDR
ncbi:MAG: hypothetical protein AB7U82_24495 [Blastocatellales bacterium]